MEKDVGVKIFNRNERGIIMKEKGEKIYSKENDVMMKMENVR